MKTNDIHSHCPEVENLMGGRMPFVTLHNACGTCADSCSWNTDVVGRNTTTADEGDDKAYCGTDNGKSTGHLVHLKYAEL